MFDLNKSLIKSMLIQCETQPLDIYNKIKGKKIDESKIKKVITNYFPTNGNVEWYIYPMDTSHSAVVFTDRRNNTYDYSIGLILHGYPGVGNIPGSITCCESNPVTQCSCSENNVTYDCVNTEVKDKQGNVVTNQIPSDVIDYAISTLPTTESNNILLLIGGVAVISVLYYLYTKRK